MYQALIQHGFIESSILKTQRRVKAGEPKPKKYALCEPADGKPFKKKQSDVKVDEIFPEKKSNQNVYLITQLTTIKVLEEQIKDTQKRLEFLLELQRTIWNIEGL